MPSVLSTQGALSSISNDLQAFQELLDRDPAKAAQLIILNDNVQRLEVSVDQTKAQVDRLQSLTWGLIATLASMSIAVLAIAVRLSTRRH